MRKKILVLSTEEATVAHYLRGPISRVIPFNVFSRSKEQLQDDLEELILELESERERVTEVKGQILDEKKSIVEKLKSDLDSFDRAKLLINYSDLDNHIPELAVYTDRIKLLQGQIQLWDPKMQEIDPDADYLVIGKKIFDFMKGKFHLGLRGRTGFHDITKMDRLGMSNGAGFQFHYASEDGPDESDVNRIRSFFSPEFKGLEIKSKYVECNDLESAVNNLKLLNDSSDIMGMDYETAISWPMEKGHYQTGVGISNGEYRIWIDFVRLRERGEFESFNEVLVEFYRKNQKRIWTYNSSFERRSTYQCQGEMFYFRDAATINLIEFRNNFRRSLKYTAQLILKCNSWDDDFDYLTDKLGEIFEWDSNKEDWTYNKDTFHTHPAWNDIVEKFPNHIDRFKELIGRNFGSRYSCIPGDILGKYCAIDAHYTYLIAKYMYDNYSDICIDIYDANIGMASNLDAMGIYKDVKRCDSMIDYSEKMMAFCSFKLSWIKLRYEIDELEVEGINSIEDYPPIAKEAWKVWNYDPDHNKWSRNIHERYHSTETESGLDVDRMKTELGHETFIDDLVEVAVETWGGKLPQSLGRTRRTYNAMAHFIGKNVDDSGVSELHHNTSQHRWKKAVNQDFIDSAHQFTHPLEVPEVIKHDGEELSRSELVDNMKNVYAPTSPAQFNSFYDSVIKKNYIYSLFMTSAFEDEELLWDSIGMPADFIEKKLKYEPYFEKFIELMNSGKIDEVTADIYQTWFSEGSEFTPKDMFDWSFKNQSLTNAFRHTYRGSWEDYKSVLYSEELPEDEFFELLMVGQCQTAFKKYQKLHGTYLTGMFQRSSSVVEASKSSDLLTIKEYEGQEYEGEGAHTRIFESFYPCQVRTKRWSAGLHTVPSRSEVKEVLTSPEDHLMLYFDIGQAEIRTMAYKSGDEKMIGFFEAGIDLYIETVKMFDPDTDFDLYPGLRSELRTIFKRVLISKLYRQSDGSTASMIEEPLDRVKKMSKSIEDNYPQVYEWTQGLIDECIESGGMISTVLGDLIDISHEPDYRKEKQGVNLVIQNFTAVVLAYGFNNLVETAKNYNITWQPVSVIHDSSTNYFDIKSLLRVNKFCLKEFRDFVKSTADVPYEFDVLIGVDNYNMVEFTLKEPTVGVMEGTNKSIDLLLDKLDRSGVEFKCEFKNDRARKVISDPFEAQVSYASQATFDLDKSYNKVTIEFMNLETF